MNEYIVFSKRLAKTLVNMGFELLRTEPNRERPQYDVFVFENTPILRSSIQ